MYNFSVALVTIWYITNCSSNKVCLVVGASSIPAALRTSLSSSESIPSSIGAAGITPSFTPMTNVAFTFDNLERSIFAINTWSNDGGMFAN